MREDDAEALERACRYKERFEEAGRFVSVELLRHRRRGDHGVQACVRAVVKQAREAVNALFVTVAGFDADHVCFALDVRCLGDDNPATGAPWTDEEIRALDLEGPDGFHCTWALSLFIADRGHPLPRQYVRPFIIRDDTHEYEWGEPVMNEEAHAFADLAATAFEHEDVFDPEWRALPAVDHDRVVMNALAQMGYRVSIYIPDGGGYFSAFPSRRRGG